MRRVLYHLAIVLKAKLKELYASWQHSERTLNSQF